MTSESNQIQYAIDLDHQEKDTQNQKYKMHHQNTTPSSKEKARARTGLIDQQICIVKHATLRKDSRRPEEPQNK